MKYIVFMSIIVNIAPLLADCTRADRTHNDSHVVRCSYTQEDIYNGYSQKPTCNACEQFRKECFYCKCPISEHSKCETSEKCSGNKCARKGPFDDEIIEKRRHKNRRRR